MIYKPAQCADYQNRNVTMTLADPHGVKKRRRISGTAQE
jgi:hypothetical protein